MYRQQLNEKLNFYRPTNSHNASQTSFKFDDNNQPQLVNLSPSRNVKQSQ